MDQVADANIWSRIREEAGRDAEREPMLRASSTPSSSLTAPAIDSVKSRTSRPADRREDSRDNRADET